MIVDPGVRVAYQPQLARRLYTPDVDQCSLSVVFAPAVACLQHGCSGFSSTRTDMEMSCFWPADAILPYAGLSCAGASQVDKLSRRA